MPRDEATLDDDIGIENASPESIRAALEKVRTASINPAKTFSMNDLISNNLNGSNDASKNRAAVGKILGIGYANSKIFLQRLNNYGISREEFDECLKCIQ